MPDNDTQIKKMTLLGASNQWKDPGHSRKKKPTVTPDMLLYLLLV
jgi:hypothetical protein